MKGYVKSLLLGLCLMVVASCGGGNTNDNSTKPNTPNTSIGGGTSVSGNTSNSSSIAVEDIGATISKIDEILKGYVPSVVSEDITLPTTIEGYNITVTWVSQNPDVIANDGKFTKPLEDTNVILTATYEYKGTGVHKVEIVPMVYGYTEEEKVEASKGVLTQPVIDINNKSVTLLTLNETYGVDITWAVTENEYAIIEENVLTVSEDAFLNGTSFTLVAELAINETKQTIEFVYEIEIDYALRLAKAKEALVKPELVDNTTVTIPLTGLYDSTIEWVANDENVVIENETVTVPAKSTEWTLLLTGTIHVGELTDVISYDYLVAADDGEVAKEVANAIRELPTFGNATIEDKDTIDAVKDRFDNLTDNQISKFNEIEDAEQLKFALDELLSKYIAIRNVKLAEDKVTWDAIAVATEYKITFVDLDKEFTVTTNEFVYGDYGMPTDTKYNVTIEVVTGDVTGYIVVGENNLEFGTPSDLPKVADPVITLHGNGFTWDPALYEGATSVRVYADGILRREMPITQKEYFYRFSGIVDFQEPTDVNFVIQFVGNGTTHQSSNFYKYTHNVVGTGQILNVATLTEANGVLSWNAAAYNTGYEVRIDDFRVYYTEYSKKIDGTGTLPIKELNLPAGTYNVKVRAASDNAGTPSPFSNEIKITVTEDMVEGPTNVVFDSSTFKLNWDAIANAQYYTVNIPSAGISENVETNSIDLSTYNLVEGNYEVEVSAYVYEAGVTGTCTMHITKTVTLAFNVEYNESQLAKPTNVVANYSGISWDVVEGAVGYEVVINGVPTNVTTNSYIFAEQGLPMNFDYTVQIRALAEIIADNSMYSSKIVVKYELENVALGRNGAEATASSGTAENAIDGNDDSQWKANPASDSGDTNLHDEYLIIDLGDLYTIHGIYIHWEAANAAEYDILVSSDNEEWETVYEYRTTPKQEERHDYLYFELPVDVQYVKFQGIKLGTQWAYSIYTFEVLSVVEN